MVSHKCPLCGSREHARADCPDRGRIHRKKKPCTLCNDLHHRVEGLKCARCGIPYRDNKAPRFDPTDRRDGMIYPGGPG